MRIDIKNPQELTSYVNKIDDLVKQNYQQKWVRYAKVGSKTVRLLGYSDNFLPHIEKQLTYILRDEADSFDATIVLWNEKNVESVSSKILEDFAPHRLRLEQIISKKRTLDVRVFEESNSLVVPIINVDPLRGLVNAYDPTTQVHYYGVKDLSTEEFVKEGHVLVQMFNKITKTPTSGIVHGAVVGLDNEGVLFCARGQRGKSTLSVLSMMKGFDYVSDDYLVLEQEDNKLYSYPIYSIITLSPRMYNELYDELEGSRFLSNNGRKDKYIVNIANYHDRFKDKYPIKFCMFPEIVSDKEPSIVPCPKGRSIVQLIQSTVFQLQDGNNQQVIKKLMDMVHDYEFYQINLCQDIHKNTECLREFMKNYDNREQATFVEDHMYIDVTFDIAHILDSKNSIIYMMTEFATNIYDNLVAGVDKNAILSELKAIDGMPKTIENDFNALVNILLDKGILKELKSNSNQANIKMHLIEKTKYQIVFNEYAKDKINNLIKEYKREK